MHTPSHSTVHHGRNLKRIREILQVKQSTLASILGEEWNQKKISQLEDKERIDAALLAEVAGALKVTPEAIEQFDDSRTSINVISSTLNDQAAVANYYCTFNPIDKIVELYEALVVSEKEKVALLENMLANR